MATPATANGSPSTSSTAAPPAAPATAAQPPAGGGAAGGGAAAPAAPAGAPNGGAPAAAPAQDPRFARAQSEIRRLERELAASKQRVDALSPHEATLAGLKDKDPAKRYAALEALGFDYKDWTEHLLTGAGAKIEPMKLPPELRAELDELKELKRKYDANEIERTTAQQQHEQQQRLENGRAEALKLLQGGGEKYELAAALGAADDVVREYMARAKRDGVEPDEQEICAHVEAQLAQSIPTQLAALAKTGKGKALLEAALKGSSAVPAQNGTRESPRAQTGQPNGLTNELSAESGDGVDLSKLTKAELRARALERAKKAVRAS